MAPQPLPDPQLPESVSAPAPTQRPFFARLLGHENLAFLVLAALWLLVLYGRVLTGPFVSGDLDQVVFNPALATWHDTWTKLLLAPGGLTHELRGTAPGVFYRPVYWLSLALDVHLYDLNPIGFHVTNLVLAWLAGFTAFRLLRALCASTLVAGAASLLWLTLPVNTEVIAWVSARAYSLSAIFIFLALLFASHVVDEKRKIPSLIGFFLAALLALLSHPAGLLVLPLAILVVLAKERTLGRASAWAWLAGLALAAAGTWFGARTLLGPVPDVLAAAPKRFGLSFFQYLRWIALPSHMSIERSSGLATTGSSALAIAAWVGVLLLAAAAVLLWRSRPTAAAGLAWTGIALTPFCGLFVLGEGMAERFVFLASAGFALFLVALVAESRPTLQRTFTGLLLLWAAWSAAGSFVRAGDWTDPTRLYTASLTATPNSHILYYNLGLLAEQNKDSDAAEHNYTEALKLQPAHIDSLLKLAALLEDERKYEASEAAFRKVIDADPSESRAYTGIGMLMYEEGHVADAESMFSAAIRYNKTDPTPYFRLGQLYAEGGSGDAALMMYQKVLKIDPTNKQALEAVRLLKLAMAQAARDEQY